MSQLLKKYALLAACAVLALCFITRPAHAQMVVPGGIGEHLLFGYWSTANYTNTNVNIHSPLGVTGAIAPDKNVVYVRIRSAAFDRNTIASFNICLNAGDSWTATLSEEGLMVMSAGGCDGDLRDLPMGDANVNIATPEEGEMVDLDTDADTGFIEAWLRPANALKDDTLGPDTDHNPEDGSARPISGTAMLVSPMSGFASSYDAVALNMCGNQIAEIDDTTDVLAAIDGEEPKTIAMALALARDDAAADGTTVASGTVDGDDGNGCWHVLTGFTDADADADTLAMDTPLDAAGDPINMALGDAGAMGGGDRDLLTGRWTAIDDDNVMSHTKLVLTFPWNLLVAGEATGTPDPVSIHIYDDMGTVANWASDLKLNMGVNTCMFGGMDMMDMFSCNDTEVSLEGAMSGEFRIFNNRVQADGVGELPELGNQSPDEALAAIGLIFSYFEGSDGKEYDQVTPVGWIDVDRDGDDPDNANAPDTAAGFTDTGLDDF